MNIVLFSDVLSCIAVHMYCTDFSKEPAALFVGVGLMKRAAGSFETSVHTYRTTSPHCPEINIFIATAVTN